MSNISVILIIYDLNMPFHLAANAIYQAGRN